MTSKSFTFWSHLVLSPPATGFMHSQTFCGLAGRMPSPLYLRGTKRNRTALLYPACSRQHRGQDPLPGNEHYSQIASELRRGSPGHRHLTLRDGKRSVPGLAPARPRRSPPIPRAAAAPPPLTHRAAAAPPAVGVPSVEPQLLSRRLSAPRAVHGGRAGPLRRRFDRPRRAAPGPMAAPPLT